MEFPAMIADFMLHGTSEKWSYKGKTYMHAEYLKVGTINRIEIRTIGTPDGKQSFEVKVRGCIIRDIATLEKAVDVCEEIIKENEGFLKSYIDHHKIM